MEKETKKADSASLDQKDYDEIVRQANCDDLMAGKVDLERLDSYERTILKAEIEDALK